jgi:hypothetical protein
MVVSPRPFSSIVLTHAYRTVGDALRALGKDTYSTIFSKLEVGL